MCMSLCIMLIIQTRKLINDMQCTPLVIGTASALGIPISHNPILLEIPYWYFTEYSKDRYTFYDYRGVEVEPTDAEYHFAIEHRALLDQVIRWLRKVQIAYLIRKGGYYDYLWDLFDFKPAGTISHDDPWLQYVVLTYHNRDLVGYLIYVGKVVQFKQSGALLWCRDMIYDLVSGTSVVVPERTARTGGWLNA